MATGVAARPPMGWNSWDCYGVSVTEEEVLANAQFMADNLLQYGWEYVVIDHQWYNPFARGGVEPVADERPFASQFAMDEFGRPLPAENRFPSAAGGAGFRPLADALHAMGLKFGLHVMRGIPRIAVERGLTIKSAPYRAATVADRENVCTWSTDYYGLIHPHPGSQAYYDSLIDLFDEWQVDFVKADSMMTPSYYALEIESLSRAMRHAARPMVLSLSAPTDLSLDLGQHMADHSQMWRISPDVWDRWDDVDPQFDRLAAWAPLARPGAWPDADMLPMGRVGIRAAIGQARHSALTRREQRTMMTLWSIARSPLMIGGDLPASEDWVIEMLSNVDVLDLLTSSEGARQVYRDGDIVAWTATRAGSDQRYVAIFNRGWRLATVKLPWQQLGMTAPAHLRNLWSGDEMQADRTVIEAELEAHDVLLLAAG